MRAKGRQRGVALFLAIFALLLLSAVGMAMLFSSDTETSISINYRDKQAAIYGALAGLQEARDRIHPLSGDLGAGTNLSNGGLNLLPPALPAAGSPNVVYLINPAPGETVAPWDPTNKYFDDELCHEAYFASMGVTAVAAGQPCPATAASLPTTPGWYAWYDNSQKKTSAGATGTGDAAVIETAYQPTDSSGNKIPLTYKWVRITMKSDNMTYVPINGTTATSNQICWDGSHEQYLPSSGYKNDCTPIQGGITNIAVTANGAGYTSTPTVTISGGAGSGATATASIGQVPVGISSVKLTNPGAGYTSVPAVTITPADGLGSGAVVNAVLNSTVPVASVGPTPPATTWATPPACYAGGSSPTVGFNPSGATASVTMTGQSCVYSITASGKCSDASSAVTASGGFVGSITWGGAGHTASATSVTNPGNYSGSLPGSSAFTISCSKPGSGANTPKVTPTYGIQINTISASGGSYQAGNPPSVTFSGAVPKGGVPSATATLSSTANPAALSGLKIPVGGNGSGYDVNPILTIAPPACVPGPSCVQATGTASISPDVGVLSIQITNPGSGWTQAAPPTVTISGGGGSGATAAATIGSAANRAFMSPVYLLTSVGVTPSGARAMAQMEVAVNYNQFNLGLGGALTLIGPQPCFGTPNSQNFKMVGTDCTQGPCPPGCTGSQCNYPPVPSSCNNSPLPARDSIGVDDPTGGTPSAVTDVLTGNNSCVPPTTGLGKPPNYYGANSWPDVHNANLGDMSPSELNSFVSTVASVATAGAPAGGTGFDVYGSSTSPVNNPTIYLGTANNPAIDVVYGNYTMGPTTGYGILVVTGTLTISGNYSWNGVIFVIGAGASVMSGGGNGQINGAVYVANTQGTPPGTLGSPIASWNGGGGNGIQYDHCWADDMLAKVPFNPGYSANALQVISLRTEVY